MANKPVAGALGYNPDFDRPTVQLQSGVKRLLTEDDATGGGGTVDEVTSGDGSVVITDPTGPSVDLAVPDRLKRTANDWAPFSLKSPPELTDVLLIEDSTDSWAKKRITISDLLALAFPAPPSPFYARDKILTPGWNSVFGPQALYYAAHDKTYIVWQMVGTDGNKGVHICYYDHATALWSDRYRVGSFALTDDDHGSPALAIDSSGYLYVLFGSHNNEQRVSISTNANDITEWTQFANVSGTHTYPKAHVIGSTLYFMNRDWDGFTTTGPLQVMSGTISGGSVTLGSAKTIATFDTDSRFYQGTSIVIGTDIHFIATRANQADTERKGIYYYRYDTVTGAMKNFDASVSVASGSLPVTLTQADASFRIYDHGASDGEVPCLEFDSNGDAHVIFAVGVNGVTTSYDVMHMFLSSGVWSTPTLVTQMKDLSVFGFVNSYALVPGASGKMELWLNDNARNMIRCRMNASKIWGGQEIIISRGSYDFEAVATVRDAQPELRVIFAETIRPTTDTSAAFLRMFVYGDSGTISATVDQTVLDSQITNTRLLLGMNHRDQAVTLIDDSPACRTGAVFAGNAQIDTAQKKFGSASLLLDGTGDYVTYPSATAFSASQTNLTMEAWVRPNEAGRTQTVFSKRSAGNQEFSFIKNASDQMQLVVWDAGSVVVVNITSTATLSNGTWYHVAFCKAGTAWKLFINGNQEASATQSNTPGTNSDVFHIGHQLGNITTDWNGWLDEIRVTAAARYTASFTAPTAAFPRH